MVVKINQEDKITKQVRFNYAVPASSGVRLEDISLLTGEITQVALHFPDGCFLSDTPILMEDGKEKAIQDILPGQRVLCHHSYGDVIHANQREYKGDIFTIKPRGLAEIYATSEHPFLVVPKREIVGRGGRAIVPQGNLWFSHKNKPAWEPQWIPATQLEVGDWLVSPIYDRTNGVRKIDVTEFIDFAGYSKNDVWGDFNNNHLFYGATRDRKNSIPDGYIRYKWSHNTMPRYIDITPELMRLLGLYIAEGNLKHEKYHTPYEEPTGVCFTFGSHESTLARECLWIIKECFGITGYIQGQPQKNTISVTLSSVAVAKLFQKLCGEHFDGKSIHPILMEQKPKLQWHLVNAIHDGDNSDGHGYQGITLQNRRLIDEVATILNRLYLKPCVQRSNETYVVTWRNRDLAKNRFYLNHWLMTPIRKMAKNKHEGLVYNLAVNPYNSYVAGKLAVHNCDALVSVAFGHEQKWTCPSTPYTYIALNDTTPVFTFVNEEIYRDDVLWVVIENADSTNAHTISVIVTLEGVETPIGALA